MASGLDYFGRGPTLETAIDALERFESEFDVESVAWLPPPAPAAATAAAVAAVGAGLP